MADLKKLIEEVVEYEQKRRRMAQCGRTTVQAMDSIEIHGVAHAGVVSHICKLQAGHVGDCRCCEYHWRGEK